MKPNKTISHFNLCIDAFAIALLAIGFTAFFNASAKTPVASRTPTSSSENFCYSAQIKASTQKNFGNISSLKLNAHGLLYDDNASRYVDLVVTNKNGEIGNIYFCNALDKKGLRFNCFGEDDSGEFELTRSTKNTASIKLSSGLSLGSPDGPSFELNPRYKTYPLTACSR